MFSPEHMGGNKDEVLSQVDLHVKTTVMEDALALVTLKKNQLAEMGDEYGANTRILPCEDENHNYNTESMNSIKTLFYKMCSLKDKSCINSSQFEKFH